PAEGLHPQGLARGSRWQAVPRLQSTRSRNIDHSKTASLATGLEGRDRNPTTGAALNAAQQSVAADVGIAFAQPTQLNASPLGGRADDSMTHFSGNPTDLLDAIQYEVSVIDYLRFTLYGQREMVGDGMSLVVGDVLPDGEPRRHVYLRASMSISDGAVRSALDRLRPLAFSAAFKLQDMIAEWILRANGVTDWPFSKKLAGYDKLKATGTLVQPNPFATNSSVSMAFWELYRFLVPFRGTVVHSGGVVLEPDGTISITRGADVLRFSP